MKGITLDLPQQMQAAMLLGEIMQAVGFAIWQLQELENSLAYYLAIRVKLKPGMRESHSIGIIKELQKHTLGTLLKETKKANVLKKNLLDGLTKALDDRNWLIHHARRDHRAICFKENESKIFLEKLEKITDECSNLITCLGEEIKTYVTSLGIDRTAADSHAIQIAKKWGMPIEG